MNRSIGCASGEEPYTPFILWALIGASRFSGLRLDSVASDTTGTGMPTS